MIVPNTTICVVILALEAAAGLCSNAFIIFSLILTSFKERNVAPCNCILISLSASNVYFTLITSANSLINYIRPSLLRNPKVFYIVYSMTLCGITSSSWLTATLCFFYFFKILHFQAGILARLKVKIDQIVPWLILTSELVSISGGFLSLLVSSQDLSSNLTNTISQMTSENKKTKLTLFQTCLIINSLPFVVAILATFSSMWFLKVHRSAGTFGTTSIRNYQSSVQTMTHLVIFYAVIYLMLIIHGLEIFPSMSWGYWVCITILFSFSLVQSCLLISGNPKLREAWRQLFSLRLALHP